jgi:hypothetical protein
MLSTFLSPDSETNVAWEKILTLGRRSLGLPILNHKRQNIITAHI